MSKNMHYDALSLFSGGLDSILAHRTIMDQGLSVLGLHFMSPFFGKPHLIPFWKEHYGADVVAVDISREYCDMVIDGPPNDFGKQLNPCVDCKVLMLKRAKELMAEYGAGFIVSGEVVGQRPMSQRPDAMNLIQKTADVADVLVRPLCALKLAPTAAEEKGLLDRSRLRDFYGRNRKPQLELATEGYGFTEIPTPAGGCVLTEIEASARFWYLLRAHDEAGTRPEPHDFTLVQTGRQLWAETETGRTGLWLCIGRNHEDNAALMALRQDTDMVLKLENYPGPSALIRPLEGHEWTSEALHDAAALIASYSPKAVKVGEKVSLSVTTAETVNTVWVTPCRDSQVGFREPVQEGFRPWKAARAKR